jgi:hypothetical protein
MQKAKEMAVDALDYAGAPSGPGGSAAGPLFDMAFRELVNSIRCVNAEPRYSFGYQTAKAQNVSSVRIEITSRRELGWAEGLATEKGELLFGERGEWIIFDGDPIPLLNENWLDFGGLVPYRLAKVYDSQGSYARRDLSELASARESGAGQPRSFAFNQESEDMAILELSHLPRGELSVIAEKQIAEPSNSEDFLDLPKNVYKFLLLWLARTLCRKLGNAEREQQASAELRSMEKPFAATNERNKRDYRIDTSRPFARLGAGVYARGY